MIAAWIDDGALGLWAFSGSFLLSSSVYFLPLTRPLWSFYRMFEHVEFYGFKLGFSWACRATPNLSSVCRHMCGCVYMYVYMCAVIQLTLVTQVAVACLFLYCMFPCCVGF